MHASLAAAAVDASAVDTDLQLYPQMVSPRTSTGRVCIFCAETDDYRRLAASHVRSGDRVLELGCSFGDATQIILKHDGVRFVIAVDNSDECTERTTTACAHAAERLRVEQTDVLANPAQCLALGRQLADPVVAFVDLGGNRDGMAVLPIVILLLIELRPVLTVVKCRALHAAAREHEAGCGTLPHRSFWVCALAASEAQRATLQQLPVADEDANPLAAPGETRLCYSFLNRGVCKHVGCTYRHIGPSHPDAVADAQKRSQLGWAPTRHRPKAPRKT